MCDSFNIRQMEAFRAVIKHGSVSRAANSLFITQSAVSKLISALEEDVELTLFERRSGRLQPTPAALKLYEHSDRVFTELSQLGREIKLLKNEAPASFQLGFCLYWPVAIRQKCVKRFVNGTRQSIFR